jgi:hypothetical protein
MAYRRTWLAFGVVSALAVAGCVHRLQRTSTAPDASATLDRKSPFLKAHLRDGALLVLSQWAVDDSARLVSGMGTRYDAKRAITGDGPQQLALDSVVLFETNVSRPSESIALLSVMSGLSAGLTVYCATTPKACFGSCPTFYVSDGTRDLLQAEGFSASIAPSLEARDVDVLFRAKPTGREVRVDMVNEAYETHVVRYANLLVAPRPAGHRVLADVHGAYWTVTPPAPATRCTAPEGDCTASLAGFDGRERLSAADSTDLGAREVIDLEFANAPSEPALLLASRQSLLPTFVLYQGFAWLGTGVGEWMARLERSDGETVRRLEGPARALGGIDVLVANDAGGWDSLATVRETGPLAADARLVPLPASRGPLRVRLRLAKGAWRVDAAALVSRVSGVTPQRLTPADVLRDGRPDEAARARLVDTAAPLTTFPGDRYTLVYRLPGDASAYELFLETKGYYLEWMREEWIGEENRALAASLFLDPAGALRRLAPAFKREEATIEQAFWRSRYANPR